MVSLQKGFGADSSVASNFENMYKMAYSHGLEAIYTLESIDVKSIRRLQDASTLVSEEIINPRVLPTESPQIKFDFGSCFREWVEPFYPFEPIQVLGLSKQAEKCLMENGKLVLGDLMRCDLRSLVFLKGLGQGHIEEIKTKLKHYLHGREVHRAHSIDFTSWLRCLVSNVIHRKKVFLCLENYDLCHFVTLNAAETMELRRLNDEQKEEWMQEGIVELQQSARCQFVRTHMEALATVFVKPWIRGRQGIATQQEILERLERVSLSPETARKALPLLSDLYYDATFAPNESLFEVEPLIFTADEKTALTYQMAVEQARTYFYKPGIQYPFHQLIHLLKREFAKQWMGFEEGFLEKALRLSPGFVVYKSANGHLEIKKKLKF